MTAYWINTFRSVSDEKRLAAYVELAGPAMLASVEAAVATYQGPAYQEALRVLGDAAERDIRIVPAAEDR